MRIDLSSVSKSFEGRMVLDNVSLTIPSKGVFSLVGPNGAGKTTILRIILGIYRADTGKVLYDGEPLTDRVKSDIGFVLERFYLYKSMTAYENVEFFYRLYHEKIDKQVMKEEINRAIDLVDLTKDKDRKIPFFSQGMKQRLCLARAIVNRPKLLVLDEPLKGLDIDGKWEMRELIKQLVEHGSTVFMNSHDIYEIEKLSTRIAVIKDGKILGEGSVKELKNLYKTSSSESLEDVYFNMIDKEHMTGREYMTDREHMSGKEHMADKEHVR